MFSSTARYALRALIYMAGLPPGRSVLGEELARQTEVPQNYLSKILHVLGRSGFLDATRGTGGGYRLSRHPDSIRLIDVVEVFDGRGVYRGCLLGRERPCTDEQPCSAHARWRKLRIALLSFVEGTTLRDLASRPVPDPAANRKAKGSRTRASGTRPNARLALPRRPRDTSSGRRRV